jgi:hypothetical protein
MALGGIIVALIAVMVSFGLTVAGVEMNKEMHVQRSATDNGDDAPRLVATSFHGRQDTVAVDRVVYRIELRDIANLPVDQLQKLKVLHVPLADGVVHTLHVSGTRYNGKSDQLTKLTVYSNGAGTLYFRRDASIWFEAVDDDELQRVALDVDGRKRSVTTLPPGQCESSCEPTG